LSANVRVWLFQFAVRVAAWLLEIEATCAEKVTLVLPAGILTYAGTVTLVLLLLNPTITEEAGAVPLRLTVQLEDAREVTESGEQESPPRLVVAEREILIEPPLAEVDRPLPSAATATTFET
jgi:hypothetical protein